MIKLLNSKNIQEQKSPFIVYADFESILIPRNIEVLQKDIVI